MKISTARNRYAKNWETIELTWDDFVKRLSNCIRTKCTARQYAEASKQQRDRWKDVGGFVGGEVRDGSRSKENVVSRSMITIDIDHANGDEWERFKRTFPTIPAVLYSTHSYTPQDPRYRIIVPLAWSVPAEQYPALAEALVARCNIKVDEASFKENQLMYWFSAPKDAETVFEVREGQPIRPSDLGAPAKGAPAKVPTPDGASSVFRASESDPREKPGVIGTFNRLYPISRVCSEIIPGVYEQRGGQWHYLLGSNAGGVLVNNDLWLYSFHSTDPAGGRQRCAFDLAAAHLFRGDADPEGKMYDYALSLQDVRAAQTDVFRSFEDPDGQETDPEEEDWLHGLELMKSGKPRSSHANIRLILNNDPEISGGRWRFNLFTYDKTLTGPVEWDPDNEGSRDIDGDDLSGLRSYLERKYDICSERKISDEFALLTRRNKFHPVRDFLNALPAWDGTERLDTLFIDVLGAQDTPVVRMVTRIFFTAAVARIFEPGAKFDYCPVIMGKEGIGKSTIATVMGGDWFTDSLPPLGHASDREKGEAIRGKWIIEVAEMASLYNTEVSAVKKFVTQLADPFRPAFEKGRISLPRQCVFCMTTNEIAPLRGDTGNRRFPIIDCFKGARKFSDTFTAMAYVTKWREQLWAEALMRYRSGQKLYLEGELEQMSREASEEYNNDSSDPIYGQIDEYLDKPLPIFMDTSDSARVKQYYEDPSTYEGNTRLRTHASACDFYCTVQGYDKRAVTQAMSRKFNTYMKRKADWEPKWITIDPRHGRQRGYIHQERIDQEENADLQFEL